MTIPMFAMLLRPGRSGLAPLVLAGAVVLGGCSSPPPATFDLSAAPRPAGVGSLASLAVTEPVAVLLVDSDRVAIRSPGDKVAYLPGAQWPDRLPRIFQAKLIQSFENASKIGLVGRPGDRVTAANALNTEIRTFEAREDTREVVVEVSAKIVDDKSGRVVAAQFFTARAPVEQLTGPSVAVALNGVARQVMAQIVRWVASRS